ncbi:MAG TPA: hypothetical protein VK636_23675 [Gemmatimonadaceae bacterium]|nr:hypothetical protein [Gemmatimonadaceae bacterium]
MNTTHEGGKPTRGFDDLRHGTLNVPVLKALNAEPMHGYAIAKWLWRSPQNVKL